MTNEAICRTPAIVSRVQVPPVVLSWCLDANAIATIKERNAKKPTGARNAPRHLDR
jgi:hypothetical protein